MSDTHQNNTLENKTKLKQFIFPSGIERVFVFPDLGQMLACWPVLEKVLGSRPGGGMLEILWPFC